MMAIFKETTLLLKANAAAVKEIASWLEKHRKMNETRQQASSGYMDFAQEAD